MEVEVIELTQPPTTRTQARPDLLEALSSLPSHSESEPPPMITGCSSPSSSLSLPAPAPAPVPFPVAFHIEDTCERHNARVTSARGQMPQTGTKIG